MTDMTDATVMLSIDNNIITLQLQIVMLWSKWQTWLVILYSSKQWNCSTIHCHLYLFGTGKQKAIGGWEVFGRFWPTINLTQYVNGLVNGQLKCNKICYPCFCHDLSFLASTSTLCSQNNKLRRWIPHQCHHHTMIISWQVTALNQLSVCPHSSLSHSSWASRTTIRRIALWTFRPSLSPQAHRQLWLQEELFHSDKPRDNRGPNYRHPPPRYVLTIATSNH